MVIEVFALAAAALVLAAESLHAQRMRRVALLAFGPAGRPLRAYGRLRRADLALAPLPPRP